MTVQIPRTVGALTPPWLSEVLGCDLQHVEYTRIGAEKGNLGHIYRLDFGGTIEPVVAKFGSTRPDALAAARRSGLYEREVRFYERLAPHLGVRLPECHGAFYEADTGHCLLLLEYIKTEVVLDPVVGIGPERTQQVLAELATLHEAGRSFLDQGWLQGMRFEGRIRNLRLLIDQGWPALVALCPDLVDPALGPVLGDRLEAMMHRMADLDQTVVHGDVKPDNLLTTTGGIAILDWQAVGFGPPSWDVASAMINCLTSGDRRSNEDRLLSDYPHDLTGYADALLFPLVVAAALTVLGDPGQPRRLELIRATAERALSALADHGAL